MNKFERKFLKILREDRDEHFTIRKDRLGNSVKIHTGHRYAVGRNGRGISLAPGQRKVEDRLGQAYALPIGSRTKEEQDGKLSIVPPGGKPEDENEEDINGTPPAFGNAPRLSKREALKLSAEMARKYGRRS